MASNSNSDTHTESQIYLSTRGGDYGLSFETVVLKGLAADGGLFLPHQIPEAKNWESWKDLSYTELAFQIFSLYISPSEIPPNDLKALIERSYSTFRAKDVTPLVHLKDNLHLLELFHGPSYSFKDCALQFLGNLFEYLLARKNEGKEDKDKHHLTIVGATSGDTGSAAIYGLRGKKDVSVVILHPKGRVSPIQEAQMTTVLDANVHNVAVNGTFDDCQDIVKALFGDAETNKALKLGAVNSINFARILAQIVYYFYSYFSLARQSSTFKVGDKVRFVVPTGNFGDILAGYFATRMGLPVEKLVVATNENDILDRFFKTGRYEKQAPATNGAASEAEAVKETLSPAMDILVSSNFERLLWFLAQEFASTVGMDDEFNKKQAGQEVSVWLKDLKTKGGFGPVHDDILKSARVTFESERVSDPQTTDAIKSFHKDIGYVLDPHTAVGATASERSIGRVGSSVPHISLSTAHPAKFAGAVDQALKGQNGFNFEKDVLPEAFIGLDKKPKRVSECENSWQAVGELVKQFVAEERQG